MKDTVAIVVPVYKEDMSIFEKISYQQMIKVFKKKYDIIVVAPDSLKIVLDSGLKYLFFPSKCFASVQSYSRLLMTTEFYEHFSMYEYILIYQLDAFVFEDKLGGFCELGYDYIGAPWLSGFTEYPLLKRKVLYVGNGGLSLRNVKSCINVLRKEKDLLEAYKNRNEDVFFSACAGDDFRVAPREVALSFAFEREVRDCYAQNNFQLPFGCHAWERYDYVFWKEYIIACGFELKNSEVEGGIEDCYNEALYSWCRRNARVIESDDLFYGIPLRIKALFNLGDEQEYYLWGAGGVGKSVNRIMQDLSVNVCGFIDKNVAKQGAYIDGLKVYAPEILDDKSKIIITTEETFYEAIENDLVTRNLKYGKNYIFWGDILPEDIR